MKKYCYTTLLGTDNYLPGVLGLFFSLQNVNSKYPLVVIVPENISQESISILEKENILYKKVKNCCFSDNIAIINYKTTFNKFHAFGLIEYDKVIFLDADIVLYKNIDFFFLLEPFAGLMGPEGLITGGVFLIKPKLEQQNYIFENYSYCDNDEQILNILYLDNVIKTKNKLPETYLYLYHHPNDFKYWQEFNLTTSEKIKDFIFNNLWLLWIKESFNFKQTANPFLEDIFNKIKNQY